jgi:hypothetical protein
MRPLSGARSRRHRRALASSLVVALAAVAPAARAQTPRAGIPSGGSGTSGSSGVRVLGTGTSVRSASSYQSGSEYHHSGGYYHGGSGGAGGAGGAGGVANANLELSLQMGYYAPGVRNADFHGESIQNSTGRYIAIDTTGHGLGYVRPSMFEATAHLRWSVGPLFAIGAYLGYHGAGSYDAPPDDRAVRAVVGNSQTLWGLSVGAAIEVLIPLGPVTIRPALLGGLRSYNLNVRDLASGECEWVDTGGVSHTDHCSPTVGALNFSLQPRVQIDVDLHGFVVGAYGGVEVLPTWGFAAGATLGFRIPGFGGRPAEALP